MKRALLFVTPIVLAAVSAALVARSRGFTPVTRQMLLNLSPDDWLMFSRTYDMAMQRSIRSTNKTSAGSRRPGPTAGGGVIENIRLCIAV